jgi:regulator of protease activity HflC (stomatin/prohibitin superfamily)
MDSALGWIGAIAEWCGRFFPRWKVVEPTQAVVKVIGWSWRRRNRPEGGTRVVGQWSGIAFWWPAVTEVTVVPVARQANNLQVQTITTTDSKAFMVAGMIVYSIHDPVALVSTVYDADDTVMDIALSCIHDACIRHDAESLMAAAHSGKLDREMRSEAVKQLKGYGVTVVKLALTDLAPCRVFRLANSQPIQNKYEAAA